MPRRTAYTKKTVKKSKKSDSYSWKKSASENLNVSLHKIVFPTLLIFTSFTFLTVVFTYKSLTRPFASASSTTSNDTLNREITALLLVSVEDLESSNFKITKSNLLIIDKKDLKITDFSLDTSQQIDVKGKYGLEPLSKILTLGMSVNGDDFNQAIGLLESTIESAIPFNINSYVVTDDSSYTNLHTVLTSGDLLPLATLSTSLLRNRDSEILYTNMTVSEVNNYRLFASSLTNSDLVSLDMTTISNSNISNVLNDITFDSPVALERKSIAILNGTNTPGLASYGAAFVKNIGGRVIATENTRTAYEESVLISDDLSSESVKELIDFFNIKTVLLKSEASNILENEISRSDITIILGFDLSNSL